MVLAILWVAFFVPESPRFLLKTKRYDELSESLQCIARINQTLDYKFKVNLIVIKLTEM